MSFTNKPFRIKVGDRRPAYEASLRNPDGTPVEELDTAVSIEFRMSHRHNEKRVAGDAVVLDAVEALVAYPWADGDTDTVGEYLVSFRVEWETDVFQTFPGDGYKTLFVEETVGPVAP